MKRPATFAAAGALGVALITAALPTASLATGPIPPIVPHPPATPPAPPVTRDRADWSGAYAGAYLGYIDGSAEDLSFGPGPFDIDGGLFGAFAGYNLQSGRAVFGAELNAAITRAGGTDMTFLLPYEMHNSVEIRARLGYAVGHLLPYVALGYISTEVGADHAGGGLAADQASTRLQGYALALGVDAMIGRSMFLRGEVQAVRYQDDALPFYAGSDPHGLAADDLRVNLGLGYRF